MKTIHSLRYALAVMAGILSTAALRAQSDDFADGNDTGWTHYGPLTQFGSTATFAVSGGNYRITSPPSPNEAQLGPARAGSVRGDVQYRDFFVSVDIKDWNPLDDASMGILARLKTVGLGTTQGYAFTYQGKDGDVQISRIDGEAPTDISGHPSVSLTPGGNYRMVFFGLGSSLEGRIYDMNNPITPLITATATDGGHTEGNCGLLVFADENTQASAAFDNYLATDSTTTPPELVIDAGMLSVRWNLATGLCHVPEYSSDLQSWQPVSAVGTVAGKLFYLQETPIEESAPRYYRLRLGLPLAIGAP